MTRTHQTFIVKKLNVCLTELVELCECLQLDQQPACCFLTASSQRQSSQTKSRQVETTRQLTSSVSQSTERAS